jgi:hypothetical protein
MGVLYNAQHPMRKHRLPGVPARGSFETAQPRSLCRFLTRRTIVSVSPPKQSIQPTLPANFEPRMLSFDVYGTLVNTPPR